MALLDTVNTIETTEAQRRRRSMGQQRRHSGMPRFGQPDTMAARPQFSAFGSGDNMVRPGDPVPRVEMPYDMREVLTRMHTNFLENRQRFQSMRAKQVAMFQAAMNVDQGGQSPAPQPPQAPTGGDVTPPSQTMPTAPPPTAGGGAGGGLPITGHGSMQEVDSWRDRMQGRRSLLFP